MTFDPPCVRPPSESPRAHGGKRVLVGTFTFHPDRNGVANAVLTHARMLRQLGCAVTVLTGGRPSRHADDDVVDGFRVLRFDVRGSGHLLSPIRGEKTRLLEYVHSNRWDWAFLHCWQTWATACLGGMLTAPGRSERVVLVSHGLSTRASNHPFPLSWIRRALWLPYDAFAVPRMLRLIDRLVVLCDHTDRDRFLDHHRAKSLGVEVEVIPNVARHDAAAARAPARAPPDLCPGRFLLSIGNYSATKNELLVLRAFRHSGVQDMPLVFVGPRLNAYSSRLLSLARKWGLRNVHCLDRLDKPEIDWLHSNAAFLVLGSRSECQPLVVLDSIAAGTPFVSTNVGCVASIAGGRIADTPLQMGAQIRTLASNPALRGELSAAGARQARELFSYDAVLHRWERLLRSAPSTRGVRGLS